MEGIWPIATVVGPILLLAVLAWAFLRNRASASRSEIERAERGARELREEIEEENAAERKDPDQVP